MKISGWEDSSEWPGALKRDSLPWAGRHRQIFVPPISRVRITTDDPRRIPAPVDRLGIVPLLSANGHFQDTEIQSGKVRCLRHRFQSGIHILRAPDIGKDLDSSSIAGDGLLVRFFQGGFPKFLLLVDLLPGLVQGVRVGVQGDASIFAVDDYCFPLPNPFQIFPRPRTAGIPRVRAMMAAWAVLLPRAVTMAAIPGGN